MNILTSLLLGIVQGLTEFLPISSSGHLVIVQQSLDSFHQPGILFDVVLHAGTLLAVVVFYWTVLLKMSREYITALLIASIPVFLVGLAINSRVEMMFNSVRLVGFALMVTGIINYLTDKRGFTFSAKPYKWYLAIVIGLAQTLAIIPGISRSGSTIFAGSKMGLSKEKAAEFSFLLSIPAILGANIFEILKLNTYDDIGFINYFVGFFTAFVFGYLSIKLVLKALSRSQFIYFAIYCLVLGVTIIALY
jgi:undecaprenyl-diphosphatase